MCRRICAPSSASAAALPAQPCLAPPPQNNGNGAGGGGQGSAAPQLNSKLQRHLQGLLNKLTEENIEPIAMAVREAQSTYSRREANDGVCTLVLAACCDDGNAALNARLLACYAALLSCVHYLSSQSNEVGALFVERATLAYKREYDATVAAAAAAAGATDGSSAQQTAAASALVGSHSMSVTNLLQLLCQLYTFDVASAALLLGVFACPIGAVNTACAGCRATPDGDADSWATSCAVTILPPCAMSYQRYRRKHAHIKRCRTARMQRRQRQRLQRTAAPSGEAAKRALRLLPLLRHRSLPPIRRAWHSCCLPSAICATTSGAWSRRPELVQPLKKWLHNAIATHRRGKHADASASGAGVINISWDDVINIPTKGRWWLVGAAYKQPPAAESVSAAQTSGADAPSEKSGKRSKTSNGNSSSSSSSGSAVASAPSDGSVDLVSLAAKQRMTTPARQAIFVVLLSAVDYMDAFEKLTKLADKHSTFHSAAAAQHGDGGKSSSSSGSGAAMVRDVVRVLVECCCSEASYNPYYAHVATQLCLFVRSYRFTLQLAVWDFIAAAQDGSAVPQHRRDEAALHRRAVNLARLTAHLLLEPDTGLHLTVLRPLPWQQLPMPLLLFAHTVLRTVLVQPESERSVTQVFARIAADAPSGTSDDAQALRQGYSPVHGDLFASRGKTTEQSQERGNITDTGRSSSAETHGDSEGSDGRLSCIVL